MQHLTIWQQTLIGFGFKRVEDYPEPKPQPLAIAQRELLQTQVELMVAQEEAERANAAVRTLTAKAVRLQRTVADLQSQKGIWKDSTQHA